MLTAEAEKLSNQARFILEKIDGTIVIGTVLYCCACSQPVYLVMFSDENRTCN